MATQVQWRGGSTAEHSTFTGAAREVTVDTQKKTLVVHDGSTAGGEPLLREDGSNSAFDLGSAATPALKFTGDTNTGIYSPGADQVAISTNGAERLAVESDGDVRFGSSANYGWIRGWDSTTGNMIIGADQSSTGTGGSALIFRNRGSESARIDSSGRLLVGTSTAFGSSSGDLLQVSHTFGGRLLLQRDKTNITTNEEIGSVTWYSNAGNVQPGGSISCVAESAHASDDKPSRLVFSTTADGASSPTERMRITSGGDVGFASGITLGTVTPSAAGFYATAAILGTGAGTNAVKFSTTTGKITYDTSSRLNKTDIEECPYGIAEVKQLLPRRYYRTDDQRLEIGFIADEVASILPEFVPFGPKSAVTGNEEDTEVIPVNVNYDKLTAVLTKALQEAIDKIEALEAKVAALEAQ